MVWGIEMNVKRAGRKTLTKTYEIMAMAKQGVKPKEIARIMNEPVDNIYGCIARHGGITSRQRPRWTYEEKRRAVELFNAGMSKREIADALKRPYDSISYIIKRAQANK